MTKEYPQLTFDEWVKHTYHPTTIDTRRVRLALIRRIERRSLTHTCAFPTRTSLMKWADENLVGGRGAAMKAYNAYLHYKRKADAQRI